jgi:hypothetical protein
MHINYWLCTVIAVQSLMILYYMFHAIPEKVNVIEFWKRQTEIWRTSYFKQLSDEKNKAEDAEAFRAQGKGRPAAPTDGESHNITG